MTYTLIPQLWYTITPATDCDVSTPNGISIHLPAGIQYFHFADGTSIDIAGEASVTQNPPLFKPASASALGGGYIESNLNVGHGAADAVAAVCTLTLGDLATGGTLADSNGQSVELEDPHKYATGTVSIPDATAAGTLTIGEWSKAWEADPGTRATGWLQLAAGAGVFRVNGTPVNTPENYQDVDAWNEQLEPLGVFCTDESIESGSPKIHIAAIEYGEAGNEITLEAVDEYAPVSGPTLTGGANGRTAVDVFNDIHEDADCPVSVSLNGDDSKLEFTAKEYGVNDEIAITGDLFSDAVGMSGGHGDYSVAELITAISGEFDDITPTAGEQEGTLVLTANTAGADANAITYTATGCFGSGTVKQGSTTRGKNEVFKTDKKILLNGDELFGESTVVVDTVEANNANAVTSNAVFNAIQAAAPHAPTPEPLGTTTTLLHGHVYTLAVAENTDLSALSVEPYGTAELWIDYTAGSVTWPTGLWWAEGSAPTLAAGKSYCIALRNDGVKLRANVQYEDTTPAQS